MKNISGSGNDLGLIEARKEMVGFPDSSARNFGKKPQLATNHYGLNKTKPRIENRDDDDDGGDILDKLFGRLHNAMLLVGDTVCSASSKPGQKDIDLITERLSECGKIAGGKDYETMSACGGKLQTWNKSSSARPLQRNEENDPVFIAPIMDDIENASTMVLAEEEEYMEAPNTPIVSEQQQMNQENKKSDAKGKQPAVIVIVDAEEEAQRLNLTDERKMMLSDYLSDDLREEAERILATPKEEWTNDDSIFVNDFLLHELRDDYRAIAWKIDSFSEYAQRNDSTASIDGSRQSFASSLSLSTTSLSYNHDGRHQDSYDPYVSYQQLRSGMGHVLHGSDDEERRSFTSPAAHIENLLRAEIGRSTTKKQTVSWGDAADEELKILGVSSFLDDF